MAQALVQKMSSGCVRAAIALFWVALSLSGLAIVQRFMLVLQSDVPPCSGTPSKIAKDVSDSYFPATPLSGAILTKSRDGSKLLDFVNKSTSVCRIDGFPAMGNKTATVTINCHNDSSLASGCVTFADIEPQMEDIANTFGRQVLKLLGKNDSEVNKTVAMLIGAMKSMLPAALKKSGMPDITQCPVATPLTQDWLGFTSSLATKVNASYSQFVVSETGLPILPNSTFPPKGITIPLPADIVKQLKAKTGQDIETVTVLVQLPAGMFWQVLSSQFLADAYATSLTAISVTDKDDRKMIVPTSPIAKNIGLLMNDIAKEAPPSLTAEASSLGLLFFYIKEGIDKTMDMSAKTVPIALLILAGMVRNVRMLLVVLPNLVMSMASALLFMYPVALNVTTATVAPSLMVAVALAMSIDYSLFLLTRFGKEIQAGRSVPDAVAIMLSTSGRIVLVSGVTLLLCFLMMLCLPVSFIYSLGIAAAITVCFCVCVSLTLTPVLLLTFPNFFSNNRRWGLTCDGCCCGAVAPPAAGEADIPRTSSAEQDSVMISKSCWPAFGTQIQKGAWAVAIVLLAIMVPVGLTSIPHFEHSVGIGPMMPTDAPSTRTLTELQKSFGVGSVFPTQLVVVAPKGYGAAGNLTGWLQATCDDLTRIAADVNAKMDPSSHPFTTKAFTGIMILDGHCQTSGNGITGKWNTQGDPKTATTVMISYPIDPFSIQGQAWIEALRAAADSSTVAKWYVSGSGPIQMDASNLTFARLPLMVALMMCVVFLVISVSFRSIIAPLRAVFCLLWMLVVTYGLAIFVYQDGMLDFLNWSQLGKRDSGAMSWLSPSMAGAMMVGLGLDYDIFYSERAVEEWEHGYSEKEAAARALGATANVITAAGCIMVVAFFSLVVSTTPVLNEIGFLLSVSVLVDCVVTTKVIIPCAMALLGKANFWPRKQPGLPSQMQVSLNPP